MGELINLEAILESSSQIMSIEQILIILFFSIILSGIL